MTIWYKSKKAGNTHSTCKNMWFTDAMWPLWSDIDPTVMIAITQTDMLITQDYTRHQHMNNIHYDRRINSTGISLPIFLVPDIYAHDIIFTVVDMVFNR